MEVFEPEIPEELISPPEKRLVQTLITKKPRASSLMVTAGMVLLIILVTQAYWIDFGGIASLLPAINNNIFSQGEVWRAFTAVLIHADMGHLVSNLYMLGILSYFVYGYFGFRAYPFWTFMGAGLVNFISVYTYAPEVRLLGASGWVYLLGGFWLTLYLFIQRQYRISRRLMRVFGMALMVFFPTSFEPTTSYRTHFIGFVIGMAMGLYFFLANRKKIQEHEEYRIVY